MPTLHDQMGRQVHLAKSAQRIVSFVPSITELLFDLGVGDKVVGRTKFCVYPQPSIKAVSKVGGTKTLDADAVHALQPDLIIASKEENIKDQVAKCGRWNTLATIPTYVSNVVDLQSGLDMIDDIGILVNRTSQSQQMCSDIVKAAKVLSNRATASAIYLIWRKPYMSVGGDTYISAMMPYAGYHNLLQDQKRYPTLEADKIAKLQPQHILLSSEPFPFKDQHIAELQAICPSATITLVDGEHYSWYGSRMLKALRAWHKV